MKRSLHRFRVNRLTVGMMTGIGMVSVCMVLLACCFMYTTGSFRYSIKHFFQRLVFTYSCNAVEKNSNLISFLDSKEHQLESGAIIQLASRNFPVQKYLMDQKRSDFVTYVKKQKEYLREKGAIRENIEEATAKKFLFYNGNIYNNTVQVASIGDRAASQKDQDASSESTLKPIIINGEIYMEEEGDGYEAKDVATMFETGGTKSLYTLEQLSDFNFLMKNCYIVDASTSPSKKLFRVKNLLKKDMRIKQDIGKPKVLIYHTHSQETFIDSRKGVVEDSVVGVGALLAKILEEEYNIGVIHDKTTYDLVDGKLERSLCYNIAGPSITKILEYNPTIEVVIDLHRDGVAQGSGIKKLTTIHGEKCAQLMFFNGLSRNSKGNIKWLPNKYIEDNLAFSFQLFLKGKEYYPDLILRTYLKSYRYNLHVKPKSILVELGSQYNTVKEAKNTMKYFAKILNDVITGK